MADPIDTAWRIHTAIVDWTGKVDAKASFALAFESAALAGILTLSSDHRRLAHLVGFWVNALYWIGLISLAVALLLVLYVVRPRLRKRRVDIEAPDNFIFFGHLRNWDPEDLRDALTAKDPLPVLTRQLVAMAQIAWLKHRLLQWSITGSAISGVLVSPAALLAK